MKHDLNSTPAADCKPPRTASVIERCVRVCQSQPVDAIVLYRLLHWERYATIVRDGCRWMARSRQEIAEDTGLTEKQVKDSMTRLRAQGWIETERHLFYGRNVNHLRVTEACHEALETIHSPVEKPVDKVGTTPPCMDPNGTVPNGTVWDHSCMGPNGAIPIHGGLHGKPHGKPSSVDSVGLTASVANASPETEADPEGVSKAEKVTKVEGPFPKKGKSPPKAPPPGAAPKWAAPADRVPVLAEIWANRVEAKLTPKHYGMLKAFRERCPEGEARMALLTALEDWTAFAVAAETAAGSGSSPDAPRLDFLLKHVGTAVNLARAHSAPATPVAAPKAPSSPGAEAVHPKSGLQTPFQAPSEDMPKSLQQLLGILNGPVDHHHQGA